MNAKFTVPCLTAKRREVKNEVFWRKDGSSFAVEYTSTPVYQNDELIGAVAVFRDISLQQQTQNALQEALDASKALK